MSYQILAYYLFTPIEEPQLEVVRHQEFIAARDIKCRVYISEEGINGQMSASTQAAEEYKKWLQSDPRFGSIVFKVHKYPEHVFPRPTVKYRKQLVALNDSVDLSLTGEHVAPGRWKEMLDAKDESTLLLDVRNDYEWEIGHFEGAELPKLESFREFPTYARRLKESFDPKKTKVMMYCTGGIRCELYSALLKKEGFEQVYQLDGGIIGYGLSQGNEHWRGKIFVFDDRLATPMREDLPAEVISCCHHCDKPSDVYYNCANMDCNALFLCCPACAKIYAACCSSPCQSAPRLRQYEQSERPKPFRRAHEL